MMATQQQRSPTAPPGRNDACTCGSGKKFKRCCLQEGSPSQHPASFSRAVATRPAASGLIDSALALKRRGKLDEAIALLRRAAQFEPGSYAAHFQLGSALAQAGQFQDAATSLTRAIQLRPQAQEAISNLGAVFCQVGSHERAITCFRTALGLDPGPAAWNAAPALSGLGNSLAAMGRHEEAIASLQRAVACDPGLADAHVNLGAALVSAGRFQQAIDACLRALELRPADYDALLNLGNAYKERCQLSLAAATYRQAISAQPGDARAHINLGDTHRDQGRIAAADAAYLDALRAEPHSATAYSNRIYLHAFAHDLPREKELEIARGWEQAVVPAEERAQARQAAQRSAGVFAAAPLHGRKLRIGIVSAELGTHAVAEFLQPLLENLDRERFHLTLFPSANRSCARSEHLLSLADACFPLATLSDAAAVELIRRERIDVLMDTSGHTATNRLGIFARRAAPVQCTYIGFWGTTGLTEMDWFLSDPDAPAACERGFSEGLWRLPRIAVSYHGDATLASEASEAYEAYQASEASNRWRPDPSGTVWLGSFNKFAKMREETFALWAGVLHAVPEARLLLEYRGTHDGDSHQRICAGLAAHGVPAERVEFIPYIPGHERHMRLYNRLDIALDTLPFNSGTTAFDALWMGVPLVALDGNWSDWIGGRMSASVLRTLGRPEWVARSPEDYCRIVRDLSRDVALRTSLRHTQRAQMMSSPLTDAPGLAQSLGDAFTGMYEHWLSS